MDPILRDALALHRQGLLAQAEAAYRDVLAAQPANFDAMHLCGVVAAQSGRFDEAVRLITLALQVRPGDAVAHDNLANAWRALGDFGAALRHHDRALELDPLLPEAHNHRGNTLHQQGRHGEALQSFDTALRLRPDYAEAFNNRANALSAMGRHKLAAESYREAIRLRPDYAEAHFNLGTVLGAKAGDAQAQKEAIRCYDEAIALKPGYAQAHANRALTLTELKDYELALPSYDRALAIRPDYEFLRGMRQHTRMHLCEWDGFASGVAGLAAAVARGERAAPPFVVLSLIDSPAVQRQAAATMIAAKYAAPVLPEPLARHPAHDRIRIGYYSADFRTHPVASLTARMFELHDRSRFEVIAFSFSRGRPADPMRRRLVAAFDRFIDVQGKTDAEVAHMSRELEIDIAIDLMGFTAGNRTGIFAARAAPVQATYLGYPGTMSAPCFDYLVADRTLVPAEFEVHYGEKIVFLPDTYMPNDSGRPVAPEPPSREAVGLPANGFVFCCFNNSYKITPDVFAVWMRILGQVPGSVLWLMQDSPVPAENLRRHATRAGIDPQRLVFAARMPSPEDHLARHRLADLFLDTLPFNAHTTAGDALWAGLPVLTRRGNAFAGRVAASLLNAIELPELVVHSAEAYEARALELARSPEQLAALRRKLEKNRLAMPLFDCATFTRHMEAGLQAMHDRQRAGLAPDHIHVAPVAPPAALSAQQWFEQARDWHRQGRLREALRGYQQVRTSQPDHFEAWHLGGIVQAALGEMEQAAASIARALELQPTHAAAHNNLGNAWHGLKRHDAAIASYDRAIAIDPSYAEAHNNRANALHDDRRYEEALAGYGEALRLKADWASSWGRRGNTLAALGRYDAALRSFEHATGLLASSAKGDAAALALLHNNCGNANTSLGRHDQALACYERALALRPEDAQAHWNKALLLLQMGELEPGWREFEWRWKHDALKLTRRQFSQPRWTGKEPLQGKTILLHCEQGLGDSIQFCRYARMVGELGARVLLEAPAALLPLLSSLERAPELIAQGSALPAFDMHCPLMSLPLAFGTRLDTVPAPSRYLFADGAASLRWRERLAGERGMKVGLAWSGRASHANDGHRSIPFSSIRDILMPGFDFVCLQKELRDTDKDAMTRQGGVRSFAEELHDFGDTAALCEAMDLVITVDTSVAHLAGALGKPVWLLLPFNADWRWMRDRGDSPWYPAARLFRQREPGGWNDVLAEVAAALAAITNG